MARRALDYLVGFTLSPVLWRKLPGSRSAGRVQSVALRLICEREAEIEVFRAREYWTIEAVFITPQGAPFTAKLTHLNGKRLDQFDLNNEALAQAAKATSRTANSRSARSSASASAAIRRRRSPPPPSQEASRKLGFGAQQTMRLAQQLYEGVDIDGETTGLITYMRTDGVQMAKGGDQRHPRACQRRVRRRNICPARRANTPAKAKNAQEAHEAIRPTDVDPEAGAGRARPEPRPAPAVRTDLEARRGLADAGGGAGPGRGRHDRRQGPDAARHRLDRRVRRVPEAVSRGSRRGAGGGRGQPDAAADGQARTR